jgi:hypothetical protein
MKMSDIDHQVQILKFVREAIDQAFSGSSEEIKSLALEAFLKIQEIEKLNKTGQVVKVTGVIEALALAISKLEPAASESEQHNV